VTTLCIYHAKFIDRRVEFVLEPLMLLITFTIEFLLLIRVFCLNILMSWMYLRPLIAGREAEGSIYAL
jgi:accessory gene regulator protein AgrB